MANTIRSRLTKKIDLSDEISSFTFEAIDGVFDAFDAGCHVDVVLGPDLVRNYSVWEWQQDRKSFSVAVKREDNGRGGSLAMHHLQEGAELEIAGPRNNFPLQSDDQPVVLIGGGIGVTPIYAMASELKKAGREFRVYYLVRSKEHAAFHGLFKDLDLGANYQLHCDDTDGYLDLQAFVQSYPENTHYYICGPEVLLKRLQDVSGEQVRGIVFFERFSAPISSAEVDNTAFTVVINSTGEHIAIPSDESILSVLNSKGFDVHYGCSSGLCGSCITDVLEGEIDHRDSVLDDEERAEGDCMCVCVSRAKSEVLVLDM
ncbi:PDR/VanB family oxidoreductase [Marinobacter xestospongiae]|uniref:PDR/VanB family oxidoreductase n=1 Tax=Marinobacter xestospongiae TaxID=994319 RepID=UPI00200665F3|nr:PDR/VanB family oxidoreductase [Marinobacter xestospongiae]MCK7568580.1 PDR/VanB family oxidoreductase [Marinobacter xestospongiae]